MLRRLTSLLYPEFIEFYHIDTIFREYVLNERHV